MRTLAGSLRRRAVHLLAASCLVAILPVGTAQAQAYVGKVCLQSTLNERETGAVTPEVRVFQHDVVNLGGNIYVVAGKVLSGDQPFVATGFGIVIGNEIYINMTTTQTHADSWVDTGINQTRLNATTLSGTFYEVGHDHNRSTRAYDSRFSAGTVTQVPCP